MHKTILKYGQTTTWESKYPNTFSFLKNKYSINWISKRVQVDWEIKSKNKYTSISSSCINILLLHSYILNTLSER